GTVIFGLYLLGIVTAILLGLILRRTLFQTDEATAFVMELPPYRLPTARSIWLHMWQRTREFLENAWTIILAVSIVIWLLMSVPVGATDGAFADTPVDDSAFAAAAGVISPALQPLGFGSWQSAGALMSGFVAKEVVVSTMAQVYGVDEAETAVEPTTFLEDVWFIAASFVQATIDSLKMIPSIFGLNLFPETADEPTDLMAAIKNGFEETSGGHGALAALSFMVFVLIYTPCMVAIAAEKQEFGAKWMWVSVIGQFILAWVMALLIFQGGKLLGIG
ncbi:MAG TPA: ferrous iron transporter B, partial [Anaerolineae bacterium]|nr:ferrous iron transporter B [Anaerolineae bacterium]